VAYPCPPWLCNCNGGTEETLPLSSLTKSILPTLSSYLVEARNSSSMGYFQVGSSSLSTLVLIISRAAVEP
ncbi:hypothetical protein PspLS_03329, partial [Pyricularia sp. CBS 133598]